MKKYKYILYFLMYVLLVPPVFALSTWWVCYCFDTVDRFLGSP